MDQFAIPINDLAKGYPVVFSGEVARIAAKRYAEGDMVRNAGKPNEARQAFAEAKKFTATAANDSNAKKP
jgi:hypothetical protein